MKTTTLRTLGWVIADRAGEFIATASSTLTGGGRNWILGNLKVEEGKPTLVQIVIECASCDEEVRLILRGMIEFWNQSEAKRLELSREQIPKVLSGWRKGCKTCS